VSARCATFAAVALLLSGGCSSSEPGAPAPAPPPTLEVDKQTTESTPPLDSPETTVATRWARRLPIDRLQASIPKVAGNDIDGNPIFWRVNNQDALSDDMFGTVLGRPDYVVATTENPAPSSLYLKFIRDMARGVCTQIVDNDLLRDEDHTLWRFAPIDGSADETQISDNLRYLAHRWLGLRLEADNRLITDLRAVFDAGTQSLNVDPKTTKAQAEGWRGVCLALFESPAFHLD